MCLCGSANTQYHVPSLLFNKNMFSTFTNVLNGELGSGSRYRHYDTG